MAELADALDSKSGDLWSCGFDSHLRYHLNYKALTFAVRAFLLSSILPDLADMCGSRQNTFLMASAAGIAIYFSASGALWSWEV